MGLNSGAYFAAITAGVMRARFSMPEITLAKAVLQEAMRDISGKPPVPAMARFNQCDNAMAWLLDHESQDVMSLAWCCAALSLGVGFRVDPSAISRAVAAGHRIPCHALNNKPAANRRMQKAFVGHRNQHMAPA